MNILFLTLSNIIDIDESGIYSDLIRGLAKKKHNVYVATPIERRYKKNTFLIENSQVDWHKNVKILKIKTGNIQKTNIIEKGLSTLKLENIFIRTIKKYFSNIKFDLIIYSTPPITLVKTIEYFKKKLNCKTYLMLKDIFPQNAVDLGMFKKTGIKGVLYKYFRKKEIKLYKISDYIGCMSEANVKYIINSNKFLSPSKVELFPNSIEYRDVYLTIDEKNLVREKYGIPLNKKVFVYGGNLGRPQGIQFMLDCIEKEKDNKDVFFLIIGDGTEFNKIKSFLENKQIINCKLMNKIPKEDYDKMIVCCDVGLLFLDYRFTIPNFPSRLLSYMQAGLPILACTDINTDVGCIIEKGGFGWWCPSNDTEMFSLMVKKALLDKTNYYEIEKDFIKKNYSIDLNIRRIEEII